MGKLRNLPYSVWKEFTEHRKPLRKEDWPYKSVSTHGYSSDDILQEARDYSKCATCGGIGRYWKKSRKVGRSRLTNCESCS